MSGPFRVIRCMKQDLFGAVEHGLLRAGGDTTQVVRRNVRAARWWCRPIARGLAALEVRALRRAAGVDGIPRVVGRMREGPLRSFLDGEPMHLAPPPGPAYFRQARRLLTRLRRAGVLQLDGAKEPNWLITPSGEPALVDFQTSLVFRRAGRVVRAIAFDRLRHLLKHKRTYCPEALTDRERRILAHPGCVSVVWRHTGKRAYNIVTRRWLGWQDREGAGPGGGRRPSAG